MVRERRRGKLVNSLKASKEERVYRLERKTLGSICVRDKRECHPWILGADAKPPEGMVGPGLWDSQLHPISHLIFSSGDEEPLAALGSWDTRPLEAQLAPTELLTPYDWRGSVTVCPLKLCRAGRPRGDWTSFQPSRKEAPIPSLNLKETERTHLHACDVHRVCSLQQQ